MKMHMIIRRFAGVFVLVSLLLAHYHGQYWLWFTAFDDAGDIRAAELPANVHPFFVGTLFQPERAALRGETPPVVRAFVTATANFQFR